MSSNKTVSFLTLGCGRNETDSEELAARLEAGGWAVHVSDPTATPDVIVVNTCGFIDAAKKESLDALLAAHKTGAKVVAVGCMAQRYGAELAAGLPEASAILSFDDYERISERLDDVLAGRSMQAHTPRDRRTRIPVVATTTSRDSRSERHPARGQHKQLVGPVPATGPQWMRRRLSQGPVAQLKLASGCDRRCSFCAIPSFRGSYVSRPPEEILGEAGWLASEGVQEIILVSENTTSYGRDVGDPEALDHLLPALTKMVARVRLTYLQPAELRPGLVNAIVSTDGVVPYFDLSFQHASRAVIRRMRRTGSSSSFLRQIDEIRELAPDAGIRSNFIVGFPGETDEDFEELVRFVSEAQLDAVGVFAYSDEAGTAAASLPNKVDAETTQQRLTELSLVADAAAGRRAARRVGTEVEVLVLGPERGCAGHQAPRVDGMVVMPGCTAPPGSLVRSVVVASDGVDLVAEDA